MKHARACTALSLALAAPAFVAAATIDVEVSNFKYTPNQVNIQVGDTVRWTNSGGFHNVRADNDAFGNEASMANWTFSHTFTSAGDFPYYCEVHSQPGGDINVGMNGLVRVAGGPPPFAINQGIAGSWFNPATSGQGFLIDILPDIRFLFVAWFTYEKATPPSAAPWVPPKIGVPEHRWMTASGNYTDNVATLNLYSSRGGVFNAPQTVTTSQVGTMTMTFTDCSTGSISFSIPGENISAVIPISRGTTGMAAYCRSLIPAQSSVAGENGAEGE
jgi:plastocyanin